jgi:hypothetical protein
MNYPGGETMKAVTAFLAIALLVLIASPLLAKPPDRSGEKLRFEDPPDVSEILRVSPGMNVSAVGDTFWWGPWDFDSLSYCMHDDPAETLGLSGDESSQFWTSLDKTAQPVYWHRTDGSAEDPGLVLEGDYSMWCGWIDSCPDPPGVYNSGYCNNVNQQFYKVFNLGPNPGNLTYKYYSDSEPGYDYTYVVAEFDHDTLECDDINGDTLLVYNGNMGCGVETINLAQFANQTVTLVFKFQSDGGWSDLDGIYSTGGIGPFVIDSITVETDTDVFDYTDFESGWNGWETCSFCGIGDYAAVRSIANLEVEDPTCTCLSGCVLALYDPEGGCCDIHPYHQRNIAVSPTIHLTEDPAWPRGKSLLRFSWYRDLPLSADNFAIWHVRYGPDEDSECDLCNRWSEWKDHGTVYYGPQPTCGIIGFNVSGQFPAHAESAQVAVGIVNMVSPWWPFDPGNQSPLYDNIQFGMIGQRAPGISMSDWDFFQDSFATDGTLNPRSTGRIDSGTNIYPETYYVQVHTVLGDSLTCDVPSGCPSPHPQGVQNPDPVVNLFFRVYPGPCIDQSAYGVWLGSFATSGSWSYARMDTARSTAVSNPNVPGVYMSRFHESDPQYSPAGDNDILPDFLFTPGTTIEYFLGAHWLDTPGVSNVYPDTSGGQYEEVEILPDVMNPQIDCDVDIGPEDQNCLLYVDHWDRRGAQEVIERGFHALDLGPVTQGGTNWPDLQQWDRYDNLAPTSDQGNSLGGRVCQDVNHPAEGGVRVNAPTVDQLLNYKAILWNAGDQEIEVMSYGGSDDCGDDVGLLEDWLDFAIEDSVLLWINANGVGVFMFVYGDAYTADFGTSVLGIDLMASFYGDYIGDHSDCPDVDGVFGSWAEDTHCGLEQLVMGSCGVGERRFNVITTESTTQGAEGVLEYAVQGGPGEYASVSHNAMIDTAATGNYKTVTDAFSLHYLRKHEPYCDSDVCVAWWIADVLGGDYWSGCWGSLQSVDVPGAFVNERFNNSLGTSYPNPMNPTARVEYSVKQQGPVTLRVFDVTGRLVVTLVDQVMPAGNHHVVWNGRNAAGRLVASGVYFYQIEANGFNDAKKMVVLK